jgi:secreted trypsin-like serine protease
LDRIISSPQKQQGNYASDIAILEVIGRVDFSDSIHPICVDWALDDITSHLSHNSVGMVMGMGLTEKDKYSDSMQAIKLPVVSNEQCLKEQNEDFQKYVTFTSFCAGWNNETGVCNGDSGGGLVFPFGSDGRWCIQVSERASLL